VPVMVVLVPPAVGPLFGVIVLAVMAALVGCILWLVMMKLAGMAITNNTAQVWTIFLRFNLRANRKLLRLLADAIIFDQHFILVFPLIWIFNYFVCLCHTFRHNHYKVPPPVVNSIL
jgi:hypothetical protein